MTAGGNTFPRYCITGGIGFPGGKNKNGQSLVKKIVPATAAMITSERATLTGIVCCDHGGTVDGVKKPSECADRTWMRTDLPADLWRRQFYSADHDLYYADPASVQKVFG